MTLGSGLAVVGIWTAVAAACYLSASSALFVAFFAMVATFAVSDK